VYNDAQVWSSLESVNLKEMIKSMPNGLNSTISSGGTNLSVGEKQLICLARAILKKTRILIIDEATANVDYRTDQIIQKTIREQFKDCTVLTIAHRLATVVDSNRILCLADGEVRDFASPGELLNDKNSILFDLTKKLSANEKKYIFDIAFGRVSLVENYSFSDAKEELKKRRSSVVEPPRYSLTNGILNGAFISGQGEEEEEIYNNLEVIRF
jgi:ABC-type multidrug transport system ATPase subunit